MKSVKELKEGKHYRLISSDSCSGAIIRAVKTGNINFDGHVVWFSNKQHVRRDWSLKDEDWFEELTDEEATTYILSD